MSKSISGIARPRIFQKWWLRSRPPVPEKDEQERFYGWELFVPWWAWPFELAHRAIFGNPKLTLEDGE